MAVSYIIEFLPDGWSLPESFGVQGGSDQSGNYRLIDDKSNKTAGEQSYVTSHSYPSWVTDLCPDAPDCSHGQAVTLKNTQGASGSAWNAIPDPEGPSR